MQSSVVSQVLTKEEVHRFGRQLILEGFGVSGTIGLVDYDTVDISNLHRQILHTEDRIGMSKVESASLALRSYNASCKVEKHLLCIDENNVLEIVKQYDIICDATDNVSSRYLLNDACMRLNKPLVSASALGWEGQITTFAPDSDSPCYRCIFPEPPPLESVVPCNDGGVLGIVTSIIGNLGAMEVINLLKGSPNYSQKMLFFDGRTGLFRFAGLRKKRKDCIGCTPSSLPIASIPLEPCTAPKALAGVTELSVTAYAAGDVDCILIDVRSCHHLDICSLKSSINIPINLILRMKSIDEFKRTCGVAAAISAVCFYCRRGVDSLRAANHLSRLLPPFALYNLTGGLVAWSKHVDPSLPIY